MVGTTVTNEFLPQVGPFAVPKRLARRVVPRPSAAFGVTVLLMVIAACVAALSQLSVSRHASSTSVQFRTTAGGRPITLGVAPAQVAVGREVRLEVVGAPGEKIVFAITSSRGTYVGPPHLADTGGKVSTKYRPSATAPTGTYRVVVLGDRGTGVQSELVVEPAR